MTQPYAGLRTVMQNSVERRTQAGWKWAVSVEKAPKRTQETATEKNFVGWRLCTAHRRSGMKPPPTRGNTPHPARPAGYTHGRSRSHCATAPIDGTGSAVTPCLRSTNSRAR